ncbi:hypothetical protein Bbelb_245620 [Branchiostoma belcheri]|nr:hypothetical protein Bbelb_245620 [Branchiostoma belcheri]
MLEATYVAGNEVEQTTTNEDYYMAHNNDIPTPEVADVYSVSDPIHAENSAMYTASGENEKDDNTIGNIEKEQQNTQNVMQADITVNDECDMEPYAVTNISDHQTYLNTTTNVRQQAPKADSIVTDDGDMEPYAVTDMSDHETYFSRTTNIRQQASDDSRPDTTKNVHKPRNPPNAKELRKNPMYIPNNQQANKPCENRRCFLLAFLVVLLLVGGITTGVYHNTPGIQKTMQEVKNFSTLNATELIHVPTIWTTDGTNPSNIGGVNGTNPPNLGTTEGTTAPNLRTTDGTTAPNLRTTDGTTPPNLGTTTEGTTAPNLGTTEGTTPPNLGTTDGTTAPNLGTTDGTTPPNLGTTDGTTAPNLGTTDGTTPPNLGTTDGTTPPNLGTTDGTTPPNLGTTEGTTAPNLRTTDGTTPPNLGTTDGTTPPNLGTTTEGTIPPSYTNELIVIHDTFLGRRENGPRCGCTLKSCDTCPDVDGSDKVNILSHVRKQCQGLQQCEDEFEAEFLFYTRTCPGIKRYLEVTYHCEAEVKKNITFRKDPGGRLYTSDNWGWGAVAVSSTNEIFVADELKKGIQVFSMEGVFVRRFSTKNKKPTAITRGRKDTLWVVLGGARGSKYDIQQYSKEGRELAKFTCSDNVIGIAWDELSNRIILSLTIEQSGQSPYRNDFRKLEIVWLSPNYSPTQACNMNSLSTAGSTTPYRQSVTVDTKGNIYVIDLKGSHQILKYGKNGDLLSSFGGYGGGPGNLLNPQGICVDSLGRVIVADLFNSRVEMFKAEGEHIRTVAYVKKPRHLATGGKGQLVIDHQNFVTILPEY